MKEHPILFSAPMIRALLYGRKTQTRRAVKPVGNDGGFVLIENASRLWPYRSDDGESSFHTVKRGGNEYLDETPHECPYGRPGDRLWVRESWRAPTSCDHLPPRSISDSEAVRFIADETVGADAGFGKGRPGMFMPRWASRIDLEITAVRVERLQDISEQDAKAEGADGLVTETCTEDDKALLDLPLYSADPHRNGYALLWESLNGDGSWAENLWVWVVEFKRVAA